MFHVKHHQIDRHIVSRETIAAAGNLFETYRSPLAEYLDRLLWWNRRVNLVSRDVSRETLEEHIRHSLLITQFDAYRSAELVVDAGTGGGLPGIPLAIASPEKRFILVDKVTKKVLALRDMVRHLGLERVSCEDRPVEKLSVDSAFLLVSKHAFGIDELWKMVNEQPFSSMIFYKGLDFENELEAIEERLRIKSYDLSEGSEYYRGKALVFVAPR